MTQTITLDIVDMTYGGRGLARLDGKVYFVPDTLPGDTVRAAVTKDKKNFAEAKVLERLTDSPWRQNSRCAFSAQCGGCQWLEAPYPKQLEWKKEFVAQALRKMAGIEPGEFPISPSPSESHYRNRVQLKCRINKKGHWQVGYFAGSTHELVPVSSCFIAADDINRFIEELKTLAPAQPTAEPFSMEVQEAPYHHKVVLTLKPTEKHLIPSLMKLTSVHEVVIDTAASKPEFLYDEQYGIKFYSRPGQFQQVNREHNHVLRDFMLRHGLEENPGTVLDVFCGSGNFSLPMIAKGIKVIGVEKSATAIASAQENMKKNQLQGGEYHSEDADVFLRSLLNQRKSFDLAIVDPPRAGLMNTVHPLMDLAPKRLIYVSCDPNTLGRDLKTLKDKYAIQHIQAFDFFPHTYHVETAVVLKLRN